MAREWTNVRHAMNDLIPVLAKVWLWVLCLGSGMAMARVTGDHEWIVVVVPNTLAMLALGLD